MNHGRLKVELEDSAGRPINTKFGKSKRKFFHAIGEIIHDQQVKFLEIVAQQEEAVAARMKAMQEAQKAAQGQTEEQQPKAVTGGKKDKKKKKKN